ncbi:MAG: CTP synthase [Candidatus Bathyarchaeota archaeon]|nr:CTP synthase [Candidatus Bathyarchaeota archaeon]
MIRARVARCRTMLSKDVQDKIALFRSVENDAVFASPNVKTVYQLPLTLDQQGLGNIISNKLNLPQRTPDWRRWNEIVDEFLHSTHKIHIAVCGKYAKLTYSYISINEALKIAAAVCHSTVHIDWIESETIENQGSTAALHHYNGILVPGGFGERGTEGKIAAIQFARESNIPFLGLCFGFQLAVVEYARNVCTVTGANSTEINTNTPHPVINLLPEQGTVTYKGASMRLGAYPILVTPRTLAAQLYRVNTIYERHRHRYEVNPEYIPLFTEKGLKFSGKTEDGIRMEILELPYHYFFLATQFHPEFKSRPGRPDLAFYGFIKAILDRKLGQIDPTFDHQILDRAEARMLRAQLGA